MQAFLSSAWALFVSSVKSVPLLAIGFGQNEGIWMHLIGAAILAKVFRLKFSFWKTFLIVTAIAIAWELLEIYIETPTLAHIIDIYGTLGHYCLDTAADIIGAMVITLIANAELKTLFSLEHHVSNARKK